MICKKVNKMDETKRELIPTGTVRRMCIGRVKAKGCSMATDVSPALSKAMSKIMMDIIDETIEITMAEKKKTLALKFMKIACDKRGILIE